MFLHKINGQEVMFKKDNAFLDRLDKQAENVRLSADGGDVAGIKGYTIVGAMFALLGIDDKKGTEANEVKLDVTLLSFYFAKILFALQTKKSFEQIEAHINGLDEKEYNDLLQQVVDEVRPKVEKTISII